MRVLAVGNMYPPHHHGGYELVWRAAMDDLVAHGHDVLVLTTDHRVPGVADSPEPHVRRTLRWYWRDHGWPAPGLRATVALERANARVFNAAVADHRPDVVAWWSMGGLSLSLVERARRSGLPAAGFVHDGWMVYGPQRDRWIHAARRHRHLATLLGRAIGVPATVDWGLAAEWVFVSEAARRRAQEIPGLRLPLTSVAHSGVDPAFVNPQPARDWGWRLLCVGRIDDRKGLDIAIDALPHLPPQARLTIAGDGDIAHEDALRAQVAALDLAGRVTFLGAVPRTDLPALYAAHDAVLFPVRWEEPWGLVPLEAMGLGRPVVATARGGAAEYLQDGENALVVPAQDPAAVAAAVARLADDPVLRDALRTGGGRTAAGHTETVFHEQVRGALERAWHRRPGPG